MKQTHSTFTTQFIKSIEQNDLTSLIDLLESNESNDSNDSNESDTLLQLLNTHLFLNSSYSFTGFTPLVYAVKKYYNDMVLLLLQYKANPNTICNDWTPLMHACNNQNIEAIQHLIKFKANINYTHCNNLYRKYSRLEYGKLSCLYISCMNNSHVDTIRLLLKNEANPNICNMNLPLIEAIRNKNEEVCKVLIDFNVNISALDKCNRNALYYTIIYKLPNITELLLQKGINVNIFDMNKCTPLYYAITTKNIPIVKILLEYKADPNNCIQDFNILQYILNYIPYEKSIMTIFLLLISYQADYSFLFSKEYVQNKKYDKIINGILNLKKRKLTTLEYLRRREVKNLKNKSKKN